MSEHPERPIAPPRNSRMEHLLVLLSTGLGVGRARTAPGTIGSLWGPLLVLGLQSLKQHPFTMPAGGILLFLIGIPVCAAGMRHYQTGDPKHVVFDEIAAFPFVFLFVPLTWGTAVLGFLLFRLFDISKLWPIRLFESLPGPWGVMADDTIAGIFAGGVLLGVWFLTGGF